MRYAITVLFLLGIFPAGCFGDLLAACDPLPPPEENLPPPICQQAPALTEGPYFTEVTADLGLDPSGLDLQGSLASTGDIDGDHWPDLLVSRGVIGARDDPESPAYNVRLLRNRQGVGFEDVTFTSGITTTRDGQQGRAVQFMLFGDLDNDGDQDIFSSNFVGYETPDTGDRSEILLNQGYGTFELGPSTRFSDDPAYDAVHGAAMLDYDHDGILDLFVGHHYARFGYLTTAGQDGMFKGDGYGGFTDVTQAAQLGTVVGDLELYLQNGVNHRPTWGVTACDVDGDTWPELMVSSYGRAYNMLWHARGDGTYRDIARDVGFASDANEDYSDSEFYRCYCHNGGTCAPMPPAPTIQCGNYWTPGSDDQPYRLGGNSVTTACGDLDNDGDMDLLQMELRHWHIGGSSDMTELLYNEGLEEGGLVRPGNDATGLTRVHMRGWNEGDLGGGLFDFDSDGRLDVLVPSSDYPGTYAELWHQQPDGTFRNVSQEGGLLQHRAHGLSLLDYDRDGDYDVVMGTSMSRWTAEDTPPRPPAPYVHLYRNDVGHQGNRLMLDLEGAVRGDDAAANRAPGASGQANRSAIGARIVVRAGDDIYMREVIGGHGLSGQQHDLFQIIGVGDHCTVDRLEIHWPDAQRSVQVFEPVRANYVLRVVQGSAIEYLTLDEYLGR